jgi:hypothetical protein
MRGRPDIFETELTYGGLELSFQGRWVSYQKALLLEPAEGGYFDEWYIKHDSIDVSDLLDEKVIERIIDRARERYIAEYGR